MAANFDMKFSSKQYDSIAWSSQPWKSPSLADKPTKPLKLFLNIKNVKNVECMAK